MSELIDSQTLMPKKRFKLFTGKQKKKKAQNFEDLNSRSTIRRKIKRAYLTNVAFGNGRGRDRERDSLVFPGEFISGVNFLIASPTQGSLIGAT